MLKLIDASLRRDEPYFRASLVKVSLETPGSWPRKILLISDGSVAQFKILLANTFHELE